MDIRFQMNPLNGFQSENQPFTAECSNRELGNVSRESIGGTHLRQQESVLDVDKYHDDDCVPRFEIPITHEHSFQEQSFGGTHLLGKNQPTISTSFVDEYDCEFADGVLKYINQMLMEEGDMDEQTHHMLEESLDFQAKERSFYDALVGPKHLINDKFSSESEVVLNFQKGVDDANKLLLIGSTTRGKNKKPDDFDEGRSKKLRAIFPEDPSHNVPIHEFDDALLCTVGELEKKFQACTLQAKGRRNKKRKEEVVDFRSLLIHCAQSIAADDRRATDEFLKQIRAHSSPFGDGEQRLAHYFADGLEARLAGRKMQKPLLVERTTASDYLRAYYTYIASSPFVKISNFVANKMIFNRSVGTEKNTVHVIDFGILYGFQWPIYIQRLAERGKKLKITGIEFPQPGFRPAERVEETGRRLARYADKFNVPFEFNAIAQNWESVGINDLKLEKGELVTVNCLYRADSLGESPRNTVLKLIRKIKPDFFVHGVVSVACGAPFFVSRFREALFHYSALFDMLESTMPRGKPERVMLERDIFGKEASNVIACEGQGRAETYKQWRLRHLRAGFVQLPFERGVIESAVKTVRNLYHRDFLISEDNEWLLMGWKGRILYALSCWQPVSRNV